MLERIVVITKKTVLEELVERHNSRAQARFYIEHLGGDFAEYEAAHAQYTAAVAAVQRCLPRGLKHHVIERGFLPNYLFAEGDLALTLGPDGLVVNTAKYLTTQPILAINPDPRRVDGLLAPFAVEEAEDWIARELAGRAATLASPESADRMAAATAVETDATSIARE